MSTTPGGWADEKLFRLCRCLVDNLILTYILGAIYYADEFHFWHQALSERATTITLLGTPNPAAASIIIVDMFINSRLLLETARVFRSCPKCLHAIPKSSLLYPASLGSFLSTFPNNIFHILHSVGSALLIGGIFFLNLVLLGESFSISRPIRAYLSARILSISVLSSAAACFAAQKFRIISLPLIILERSFSFQQLAHPGARPLLLARPTVKG